MVMDGKEKDDLSSKEVGKAKRSRLALREGYEHLGDVHNNSYPTTVQPDVDAERFDRSLDALITFA
jgi:hypothetical protein